MDNPTEPQMAPVPENPGEQNNTLMGILAYLGILVLIPLLTSAKNDPFVKFHAKQGLVLFIAEIVLWVVASFFWMLWPLWQLCNLAFFILAIVGIVNAVQKKEKELPIIGSFAKHLSF